MANKVLLKKSSTSAKIPLTSDLDYGELAINYTDGKLYFKNSSNNITSFDSSASDLLTKIKTVDGSGSGLDADTLDGVEGSSYATLTGTQTLTNKTLTSPTISSGATVSGTVVINSITYPSTDGTEGQVLTTNGNGQLTFASVSEGGVVVGGYSNSSLNAFPSGDYNGTDAYVGEGGSSSDAFGVSLLATFSCMDPVGSLQQTDLGVLT